MNSTNLKAFCFALASMLHKRQCAALNDVCGDEMVSCGCPNDDESGH